MLPLTALDRRFQCVSRCSGQIGPRDDVEQFFLIGRQTRPYLPQFVDRVDVGNNGVMARASSPYNGSFRRIDSVENISRTKSSRKLCPTLPAYEFRGSHRLATDLPSRTHAPGPGESTRLQRLGSRVRIPSSPNHAEIIE